MTKNKQPNLTASVKMLNIGVINKYTINLIRNRGGVFSISLLPIISLKYLFISPLLPNIFLYKL